MVTGVLTCLSFGVAEAVLALCLTVSRHALFAVT
jgi:hypothetical protein